MLVGAGGVYAGYGLGFFTILPISMACLAGVLAVAAGKPDEEKAHF